MSDRAQWLLVGVVIAALVGGLFAASKLLGGDVAPIAVGEPAPDFRAAAVPPERGVRTLADYRGRVVLLNVWATWCTPCREEMPSLERLHREFAPSGLSVVAVSVDDAGGAREIRAFATELGLTFDVVHDSTRAIDKAYQLTGYPVTVLIDREGRIRRRQVGAVQWDSYANRAHVASLLGVAIAPAAGAARPAGG